ncbi:alpha/beta fold hydrolase [Thauera butanivorans]|uniref:alpha/beta fold hydrolase n=1 Tax=Thauera butanivorans TaxID=86174 RepID=UPI003AB19729
MKKNLLAASLALALGSLSGAASAALEVNTNGVGQINVLPYYSVQDSYNTLMTITNTDLENGKAVKVRFRAAEWSDDALDFQIFLSPGDVWTGAFGMDNGNLVLRTSDKSCSLPAQLDGQQFTTIRVEDRDVNRLKEGYVEILTMADIPFHLNDDTSTVGADGSAVTNIAADGYSAAKSNNPLYKAIKHASNGVPTCDVLGTSLVANNSFESRPATPADPTTAVSGQWGWMVAPTSSLTSSATVIAVQDSKAFTVAGTAIRGLASDFADAEYFRQANTTVQFGGGVAVDDVTADRLFWPKGATFATELGAGYPVYQFDMPDLSTPFDGSSTPEEWRDDVAVLLQKASLATDYVVAASIGASTDVVLSQPVRRYFYDYTLVTPADGQVKGEHYNRVINTERYLVGGQNETPYAELTPSNRVQVGAPTFFDREEQTFVSSDDIVASPQEPSVAAQFFLEGETSVVSIKNGAGTTGAVGARLTNVDWSFAQNYTAGWAVLSTVAQENGATAKTIADGSTLDGHDGVLGNRLPVIGFTAINIFNSGAGANGTNYGQVLPLRVLQ